MSVAPGDRIGPYEVTALIGEGGMGQVYRATDTKLERPVALKVMHESFAANTDRVARFDREAKLLASLNHPNIAQIYGIAAGANQTQCIVMELVQGETLQARLKRGGLEVEESVGIARQIAAALEAAHERGIIHRDLKPGNVMVDTDVRVKVLDFGLGKALDPQASAEDLSHSPTVAPSALTGVNVLIGTVAYMSPEQVRGRRADERSDIWAFGCVLYEMLTGRQAFAGETASDVMGDILRVEPDWKALPAKTPPGLQLVLKRCLQKDRRQRYHAAGDLRHDLETPAPLPGAASTPGSMIRERIAWGAAAAGFILASAGLVRSLYFAPDLPAPLVSRFVVDLPQDVQLGPTAGEPFPSVSPDGRFIVFRMASPNGYRLWLRPIGSVAAQPIAGSEGVIPYPFWSADSRYIGFFAAGQLKKVAVDGGPPQVLTDASGLAGTWNRDDAVLFDGQGVIRRTSGAGGESTIVRAPDKTKNEVAYLWPSFLPDGRHFLYLAVNMDPGRTEIRVGSLDDESDVPLLKGSSRVLYGHPNHLLFVRDGTLMAQPFDPAALSLRSQAFPVAESIGISLGGGTGGTGVPAFGVADNGTLVYRVETVAAGTELTWFDRSGKRLGLAPTTGVATRPILFPDQNRVLIQRSEGSSDLWILDVTRGTSSRFTFDPATDQLSTLSRDGTQVAFASNRGGTWGLYLKPATGVGAEQLIHTVPSTSLLGAADWSPDGRVLIYNVLNSETGQDVFALPMAGDDRKAYPVLNQKYDEYRSRLSPDGRWMLYISNETGRTEVYVQAFPPTGGKWQVSINGANYAYWTRRGTEIVFDGLDRKIMAVDVKLGATFEAGIPRQLFEVPAAIPGGLIGVTADAQRFLVPLPVRTGDTAALRIVLNWPAEIRR